MKEENSKDNTVLVVTLLTSTVLQINHPGRNQPLQYSDYHCTAATPPSKGEPAPLRRGETSSSH